MTILELREKRAKAWEAAKAFLDAHRTGNGTLTAEDDATYTKMENEISDLGKEIARLERQEALDAELNKPVNRPITGQPTKEAQTKSKTLLFVASFRKERRLITFPINKLLLSNIG